MDAVRYIPHDAIDVRKWDACLEASPQGLVYAYSWYLNIMSPHWNALVLGDYEAVMPLTGRRKWGIDYLYQPAFCAELGVFSRKEVSADLVRLFLENIPAQYRYIDICLNRSNNDAAMLHFKNRSNYVLSLYPSYEALQKKYYDNHVRNIRKAISNHLSFIPDLNVAKSVSIIKSALTNISSYTKSDWERFQQLYSTAAEKKSAVCVGVTDTKGALLSTAVFFHSNRTWFYIAAGSTKEGKAVGASHFLVDSFIRSYAGTDLYLDFEGSDVDTVAFFYKGFGAVNKPYPSLCVNRLPLLIRWLKN